jgi:fluoride exporter
MTGAAGMVATTCLAAASGGVGAALRLGLNGLVHRRVRPDWPVAMSIINVTGSFVLGLVTGLAGRDGLSDRWSLLIGVGLVGGFTAFSTTSLQTLRLVQDRRIWLALANSLGMVALAVLMAGLGIWLGRTV